MVNLCVSKEMEALMNHPMVKQKGYARGYKDRDFAYRYGLESDSASLSQIGTDHRDKNE